MARGGSYYAPSVGLGMYEALQGELEKRELQRRQMVAEDAQKRQEAAQQQRYAEEKAYREQQAERQRKMDDATERERRFQHGKYLYEASTEGQPVDEATRQLWEETGMLGAATRMGQPTQGAQIGDEGGVPIYDVTPGVLETRGGPAYWKMKEEQEFRDAQARAAAREREIAAAENDRRDAERAAQVAQIGADARIDAANIAAGARRDAQSDRNLPTEVDTFLSTLKGRGLNRAQAEKQFWAQWGNVQAKYPELTAERAQRALNSMFAAPKESLFGDEEEPTPGAGGGARPVSQTQLAALAKANGLSVEQVRQRLIAEAAQSGQQLSFVP